MAFASIRSALKYIALLRSYEGSISTGGVPTYTAPVMINCYPSVENRFVMGVGGGTVVSKSVLYVSADVAVKEQDIIILENASPNWLGKNFANTTERDQYYAKNSGRLIENTTWCCVNGTAQYWDGTAWSVAFDGTKQDGEIVGGFLGKAEEVKGVPKYFDGFGWEDDAENEEGLSIQEIEL